MIPIKTVNDLIKKHALLERELSSGEIDKNSFAEKSKEYADLNEIIKVAKLYISYEKNKKEIQTILEDKNSDQDMVKMAETELNDLKIQNEKDEKNSNLQLSVVDSHEDELLKKSKKLVDDFGEFDPTLELKNFNYSYDY